MFAIVFHRYRTAFGGKGRNFNHLLLIVSLDLSVANPHAPPPPEGRICQMRSAGHVLFLLGALGADDVCTVTRWRKVMPRFLYFHGLEHPPHVAPNSTITSMVAATVGLDRKVPQNKDMRWCVRHGTHLPKPTTLWFSHGWGARVTKNCDPFVCGPSLAIARIPDSLRSTANDSSPKTSP